LLPVDRKKRHKICKKTQIFCPFLRQLKQALASKGKIGSMWKFSGSINYICNECGDNDDIPIEDFNIDCVGGSERGMGQENIYEIRYDFDCPNCDNEISLNFEASEYPVNSLSFVLNNSTGAETTGEPDLEHIDDSPIYLIPEPEIIVPDIG